jgi:hypothetical protein
MLRHILQALTEPIIEIHSTPEALVIRGPGDARLPPIGGEWSARVVRSDLLRALPKDEDYRITRGAQWLEIEDASGTIRVETHGAPDYTPLEIPQESSIYACLEDARDYIVDMLTPDRSQVLLHIEGQNRLSVVGISGPRLHRIVFPPGPKEIPETNEEISIPSSVFRVATRIGGTFQVTNRSIRSDLYTEVFSAETQWAAQYHQIIPALRNQITIDLREWVDRLQGFIQSLARAKLKNPGAVLEKSAEGNTIYGYQRKEARIAVTLPTLDGEVQERIGIDHIYLRDAVRAARRTGATTATLDFGAGTKPVALRARGKGGDFLAVIMPLRID